MELYFLVLLVAIMVFALTSGYPVAFALPGSAVITIAIAAYGELKNSGVNILKFRASNLQGTALMDQGNWEKAMDEFNPVAQDSQMDLRNPTISTFIFK